MTDSKIPSLQQRSCGYLRAFNIGKWFLVPIAALCCLLWVFVVAASIFSAVYEKSASSRDDYPPIRWKDTLEDCDPLVVFPAVRLLNYKANGKTNHELLP